MMGMEYRIVELNSGEFAIEKKLSVLGISPFGWKFVCVPHPECSHLVNTFSTVEEAKKYFVDPMGIKRIVENLTPPPRTGENGNPLEGCGYSPVVCETCGWHPCDGSC